MIRALILAALLGVAPTPKQDGQSHQRNAPTESRSRSAAAAGSRQPISRDVEPVEPIQPPEISQDCEGGLENRRSDLCAQWKAADAAADAAFWAKWSFVLGMVGTLGLFATLYYTRAAVRVAQEATRDADSALSIAERNAQAAADQVALSATTARKQLRAYMGTIGAAVIDPNSMTPHVVIDTKNFGQTPAYDLRNLIIINVYRREPDGGTKRTVYNVPADSVTICEPGHVQNVGAVLDHPIDPSTIGMEAELTQIFVDVFGTRRWRRMTYQLTLHSYHLVGKIALNSAPHGNAEGEGEPPQTGLVTGRPIPGHRSDADITAPP